MVKEMKEECRSIQVDRVVAAKSWQTLAVAASESIVLATWGTGETPSRLSILYLCFSAEPDIAESEYMIDCW